MSPLNSPLTSTSDRTGTALSMTKTYFTTSLQLHKSEVIKVHRVVPTQASFPTPARYQVQFLLLQIP